MHLTFGNRLSYQSWTRALSELPLRTDSIKSWNGLLKNEDIQIDLSSVGFADFIVLGRLLCLIYGMANAGATISIRLPSGDPLPSEAVYYDSGFQRHTPDDAAFFARISRRRRQRDHCRLYLRQSGFEAALTEGSWPTSAVTVLHTESPIAVFETNSKDTPVESPKAPQRSRHLLPYKWIPPLKAEELDSSSYLMDLELSLSALGLPVVDATAITQCVLRELIENVGQHASADAVQPSMALVGGTLLQPETYRGRLDDLDPNLSEFLLWGSRCMSPLLRLLVADAGAGIISTLGPHKPVRREQAGQPTTRPVTDAQDTLLYSFGRWATSSAAGPREGAYGLWKVERLIKSYRGSILISAGSDVAGYAFGDSSQPIRIAHSMPTWQPGTSVECNILTKVPDVFGSREGVASQTSDSDGIMPLLSYIIAPIAPREGFAESDVHAIQNALRSLPEDQTSGLVIFAELLEGERGLASTDLLNPLKRIFTVASEAANPSAVALVFSGVNYKILSLAIDEFNEAHDDQEFADVFNVPNPILIIGPHNRHFWVGGSPELRQRLSELSEVSSSHDILVSQTSLPAYPSASELRQIHDQSALLRIEAGRLELTLRPQDALDALASDLQVKIRDTYAAALGPGVQKGLFLTPSLRITTRWSDPNEVLRNLGSERLAGFLLASFLERRALVKQTIASPPVVVKVGSAGPRLLYSFSLSLSGAGEYFESVEDLRLEHLNSELHIRRHVILCTDLISSGFSLLKTIFDLKRLGLTVDVIATVVDARGSDESLYQPDEFRMEGVSIPLVSLATVSIGMQTGHEDEPDLIPIDPVLSRPIQRPVALPKHLKDQQTYMQALTRTRAARLGHIRRPSDRHYSAYVDPTMLFRDPQWASEALWICKNKVLHRQRSIFADLSSQPNVCILYPGGTGDQLSDVAQALAAELRKQHVSVDRIMNIRRGVLGARWMFPESIEMPSSSPHAVILDSGTSSGHSVQQMTRLALAAGASAVTAIVLLDALSDADALALQQIRALGRPGTSQDLYEQENLVPFALYFVSGTAVNSNSSQQCPICSLRRRYSVMRHPLPERLRKHHSWLINNLQARSKERVFQEEPTDLLGVPIDQHDCIQYLIWKSELRKATVNTLARRDLYEHIKRVAQNITDTSQRDALVRLLVAESHWLRVAPMWFPEVRSYIVSVAKGLLSGPQAMSADPILRIQAAILLALASPDDLVDDITSLIRDAHDHAPVVCQLLLEAHLLLDLPSGEPSADLTERLVRRLAALEGQVSRAHDRWPWSESAPLEEIRSVIALGRRLLAPLPESPQEAWATLGNYRIVVRNHTYDPAIWRIQLRLENLSRGLAPRDPAAFRLDWGPCRDFLSLDVLPNLEQLRPVFLSKLLMSGLNNDDSYTWNRVINGDGFALLEDITNRLEKASILSGRDGLSDASNLALLQADLRWWNDFFLAGNISDENEPRPAYLAELIGTCPTYVMDVVKEVFDDIDVNLETRGLTDDDALSVFCSKSLLKDVLCYVRMAAERQPGVEGKQEFGISVQRADKDTIALTAMVSVTSGAVPSRRRYLSSMQDELQRFGASLEELGEMSAPWAYGVSIILQRWKQI